VGWSTGVCAWTSSSFSFCLAQHRHLFTSSPEALAFSAIIQNKNGVGRSEGCGNVTMLSLFDEVVCCAKMAISIGSDPILVLECFVGLLRPRFTRHESRPGILHVSWILVPIAYQIRGKLQKYTPQAGSVSYGSRQRDFKKYGSLGTVDEGL
jgi:hypothetical protein